MPCTSNLAAAAAVEALPVGQEGGMEVKERGTCDCVSPRHLMASVCLGKE